MAVIKCKMCGGDLVIEPGSTVAECEFCGSKQTIPNQDNDKKLMLFARANRLRMGSEFDKAAGIYESIVADFPEEAEAYWGLVLCKYGIEYVDDPASGKKIPTCHRSSFDSVMEDADFEQALENADGAARKVYRDEAKAIEEIRKGIIEVSGKEEPYDIFICYKETAENGDRTIDSVIAQDVYDALTAKGYRVFFSRITLEDKLGQEYEPYIFAALNSAKIMLAFGTDYEYYNAVWVKNEWSRYLKLMAKDKTKHLIPCYKNIDAYDMPKEFARLQAQDMGKVGAMQDLLRGIGKILPRQETSVAAVAVAPINQTITIVNPNETKSIELMKQGYSRLEKHQWKKASGLFDEALKLNSNCAEIYVGRMCAKYKLESADGLAERDASFERNPDWKSAIQCASAEYKKVLLGYLNKMQNRILQEKIEEENNLKAYQQMVLESRRKAAETPSEKISELAQVRSDLKQCRNFSHFAIFGNYGAICLRSDGAVLTSGQPWDECEWTEIAAFAGGIDLLAGLKFDGSVVLMDGREYADELADRQIAVADWEDITAIDLCFSHIVGLKSDGSVMAAALSWSHKCKECDVTEWSDIISICSGSAHTAGLKSDGTVVLAYDPSSYSYRNNTQFDVSRWSGITALVSGSDHIVGLKSDGSVVATGNNDYGKCEVSDWRNIVEITASYLRTVGLTSWGTVEVTGNHHDWMNEALYSWTDIVAVDVAESNCIGLKMDGTVVVASKVGNLECKVSSWKDIVSVCAGWNRVFGLKSDGTIITAGIDDQAEYSVPIVKLCENPKEYETEKKRNILKWRLQNYQNEKANIEASANQQENSLQEYTKKINSVLSELANLKGWFTGKRKAELQQQIALLEENRRKVQTQIDYLHAELTNVEDKISAIKEETSSFLHQGDC